MRNVKKEYIYLFLILISNLSYAEQTQFSLNSTGHSHLYWPMSDNKNKWDGTRGNTVGTGDHSGDDYYADDWNIRTGGNSDAGSELRAVGSGTVIFSENSFTNGDGPACPSGNYANQVIIQFDDNDDFAVRYTHMQDVEVSEGDHVKAGEIIGTVGYSGLSGVSPCLAHLHLVLYKNINELSSKKVNGVRKTGRYFLERGDVVDYIGYQKSASKFAARFSVDAVTDVWHGNASIIDYSTNVETGYGLTYDVSQVNNYLEPQKSWKSAVFFQWEVDTSNGDKIKISTSNTLLKKADITFGSWGTRSKDITYKNVTLPFIIDPRLHDFDVSNGKWFVIKTKILSEVHNQSYSSRVYAHATFDLASEHPSVTNEITFVDGYKWNGNGSIISYSSGSETGFGLTYDVSTIDSLNKKEVVFFQWEVDSTDGNKLKISVDDTNIKKASITIGSWSGRSKDKLLQNVTLPYVIDPQSLGLGIGDGAWFVVKVAFNDARPLTSFRTMVRATVQH